MGAAVSVEALARLRPDCNVAGWTPMSANRVHSRLLHAHIRRGTAEVVIAIQTPGPLDRARAKDESATMVTMQCQRVRCGP